jgi:hypothetical protein
MQGQQGLGCSAENRQHSAFQCSVLSCLICVVLLPLPQEGWSMQHCMRQSWQ